MIALLFSRVLLTPQFTVELLSQVQGTEVFAAVVLVRDRLAAVTAVVNHDRVEREN